MVVLSSGILTSYNNNKLGREILLTYFLCISSRGILITYVKKNLKQLMRIPLLGKPPLTIKYGVVELVYPSLVTQPGSQEG